MRTALILAMIALLGCAGLRAHDFYVSVTKIRPDSSGAQLVISMKVFTSDLEAALSAPESTFAVKLDTPAEVAGSDSLIDAYLRRRVDIVVNGDSSELQWLGKRYEFDATWVEYRLPLAVEVRKLDIRNEIFTDIYDGQTNIVQVTINGRRDFYLTRKIYRETIVY